MSKYTADQVLEVSTALHRAAHSNGARTAEAVEMLDFLADMLNQRSGAKDIIEEIAMQWDGCIYEGAGYDIDIGESIRTAGERLLAGRMK